MSILDNIQENQIDVLSANVKNDISGSNFHFDPFKFRYLLLIAVENVDYSRTNYNDYVNDLDYIFSSFSNDYQIMLRKINLERLSDDNVFTPLLEEEYDMMPVDHRINYWRAIFVQFDTIDNWPFKKTYRFIVSLAKLFSKYEELNYKPVYIYKQMHYLRDCICISEPSDDFDKYVFVKYNEESYPKFEITEDMRVIVDRSEENYKAFASMVSVSKEFDQTIFAHNIERLKAFDNNSGIVDSNYFSRGQIFKSLAQALNNKNNNSSNNFYESFIKNNSKKRKEKNEFNSRFIGK